MWLISSIAVKQRHIRNCLYTYIGTHL